MGPVCEDRCSKLSNIIPQTFQTAIYASYLNATVELPAHNFSLPQALTKEVINANSGEVPQNSLAEHIMQKFIEVFHVVLSVKALYWVS